MIASRNDSINHGDINTDNDDRKNDKNQKKKYNNVNVMMTRLQKTSIERNVMIK